MLKAKQNFLIYKFFSLYTIFIVKKCFYDIKLIGDYSERGLPILLLSNHTSWWDGFWSMYLNLKVLKRKFYFMMLEEELKRHIYFNYSGGYSIRKNSKDLLESLDYTAELLKKNENLVLFFPQGRIESQYKIQIKFQSGLKRIFKKLENPISIIFQANFVEYLNHKKPTLYVYFQEYHPEYLNLDLVERDYNLFFERCLIKQREIFI